MSDKRTSRPCDQCRKRKVKCNYIHPCDRCQSHNLICAFDTIRKKKGPQAGRGAVLDRLRAQSFTSSPTPNDTIIEDSGMIQSSSVSISHHDRSTGRREPVVPGIGSSSYSQIATPNHDGHQDLDEQQRDESLLNNTYLTFDEFARNILSSSWQPPDSNSEYVWPQISSETPSTIDHHDLFTTTSPALQAPDTPASQNFQTNEIIERGVDLFFSHTYPIYPIIDEISVRALLSGSRELERVEICFLWSICALTLVTVDSWPTMSTELRAATARKYIRQCLKSRIAADFIEAASVTDVLTSLFIAVAYFDLKCRKTSWFYLKEAITLAQLAGLGSAERNTMLGADERLLQQRIYALLYITERGACMHDKFPVSILQPPELLCDTLPGEDPAISLSLSSLFHLFSLLDMNFIRSWNEMSVSPSTVDELTSLQEKLRQPPSVNGVAETQRANILITQQWLRLMVWQTALRLGLISSTAADPAFMYTYPLVIASSLCEVLKTLAPIAIQVHGLGIVS